MGSNPSYPAKKYWNENRNDRIEKKKAEKAEKAEKKRKKVKKERKEKMQKVNQKIITLSFLAFSGLIAFCFGVLVEKLAVNWMFLNNWWAKEEIRHGVPVVLAVGLFLLLQFRKSTCVWAEEVLMELKRVVFPSRKDVMSLTIAVCIMVLISSAIIAVFDLLSGYVVGWLVY